MKRLRGRRCRGLAAGVGIALCLACASLAPLPAVADLHVASGMESAAASSAGQALAHSGGGGSSRGYDWRGGAPTQPDWRGIRRDVGYFLGYQFAAIGALYLAPESISGWTTEQKEDYSFSKWRDNVSEPVWDEDVWWINYVLHPYWGGAYYVQARERGLDRAQSFLYSALISTLYEYGAEALAEPVSIQDMVVTPVAGFLVGEYLFAPLRQRIRAKPGALDWSDKATLFVTDPLGVINAETDRVLGVKTTLRWQPIGVRRPASATGAAGAAGGAGSGEAVSWTRPVWGLQLTVDW